MKNPHIIDEVAKDYFRRFACESQREEALAILSEEQSASREEVSQSINLIHDLTARCREKIEQHVESLLDQEQPFLEEPNLEPVFQGLPYSLSPKSKKEIIRHANLCIARG